MANNNVTNVYKGNPYTGYPMIIIWIILTPTFILTLFAIKGMNPIAFFTGGLLLLFIYLVTKSLYYYETDSSSLRVRQYFGKEKITVYSFDEIAEVKFMKVKLAIHIAIKDSSLKEKTYPSGTLSRQQLLALQANLENHGVHVSMRIERNG